MTSATAKVTCNAVLLGRAMSESYGFGPIWETGPIAESVRNRCLFCTYSAGVCSVTTVVLSATRVTRRGLRPRSGDYDVGRHRLRIAKWDAQALTRRSLGSCR